MTPRDPYIYSTPKKSPGNSDREERSVVWDTEAYNFFQEDCPPTANKLLWRQGQLCSVVAGLYFVTGGIYQVRGFDLANMTIVKIPRTNGVIIIDCLTSDHFGSADAIIEEAKEAGQTLRIFGPDGFLKYAVSESLYAGAAISRRSIYMYGEKLDKSTDGKIGAITQNGGIVDSIDGLQITCQLTPGAEAPAEVNYYFPYCRALCAAENATHTLHSIQALRGATVRDARLWSRYLDETITLFCNETEVVFASHHWPTWNENEQRDYYAYLHNESLRQINNGQTPRGIAESLQMRPTLSTKTHLQGCYGSISHSAKAIYDKYKAPQYTTGWFDGNPANLWPLQPTDEATEYVKCMGGTGGYQAVLDLAQGYITNKEFRFAATILDKLVFAMQSADDKDSDLAKEVMNTLAGVYTVLGHGSENVTWRNIYLTGAHELFDTIAIIIDGPATIGKPKMYLEKDVTIDFMVSNIEQNNKPVAGWHLRLSNAAFIGHAIAYVKPSNKSNAGSDLTIWSDHRNLVELVGAAIAGKSPVIVDNKKVILDTAGDVDAWTDIMVLIKLPSTKFNIVTP
ncbi:hydrolase [Botrytis cinerea]